MCRVLVHTCTFVHMSVCCFAHCISSVGPEGATKLGSIDTAFLITYAISQFLRLAHSELEWEC